MNYQITIFLSKKSPFLKAHHVFRTVSDPGFRLSHRFAGWKSWWSWSSSVDMTKYMSVTFIRRHTDWTNIRIEEMGAHQIMYLGDFCVESGSSVPRSITKNESKHIFHQIDQESVEQVSHVIISYLISTLSVLKKMLGLKNCMASLIWKEMRILLSGI